MPPFLTTKVLPAQPLNALHPWQSNMQQSWMIPPPTTPVPMLPLTHDATTASYHIVGTLDGQELTKTL